MLIRRSLGQRPRLIFTADFHELLQGDLVPGPCLLRYDPFRIVPEEEREMPRPITFHLRQHPGGALWVQEVICPPGQLKSYLWDAAGQGFMLEERFTLEEGTEGLECWFSYTDEQGRVHWDSKLGGNFWLRFAKHDLTLEQAVIASEPGSATGRMEVGLRAVAAVEAITLRWRVTHPAGVPRQEIALVPAAGSGEWSTPAGGVPVPLGATAVFDLVYRAGGHEFTDDNEGTWYLATPLPA